MKYIILILLTVSLKAQYITSYDSLELAGINQRLVDSLKVEYKTSCTEYSKIIKHPDRSEWALMVDTKDARKPQEYLTEVELPRLTELPLDWQYFINK